MVITTFELKKGKDVVAVMNCYISYDVFTGLHTADLLGGAFANCYGQGSTPDSAVTSLKMRLYQLRSKN